MTTNFPFLEVPKELHPILGTPDKGTRLFRREGSEEECAAWFEFVMDFAGPSVSPGGVCMFCPVSRAAVHKRLKEGNLTAFLFHVTFRHTTLFGSEKILRKEPYCYIPTSECQAWRKELEERAIKQGKITREELEGKTPDWKANFMSWREKRERLRLLAYLKSENISLASFVKDIFR